jgi:hypothetical protein
LKPACTRARGCVRATLTCGPSAPPLPPRRPPPPPPSPPALVPSGGAVPSGVRAQEPHPDRRPAAARRRRHGRRGRGRHARGPGPRPAARGRGRDRAGRGPERAPGRRRRRPGPGRLGGLRHPGHGAGGGGRRRGGARHRGGGGGRPGGERAGRGRGRGLPPAAEVRGGRRGAGAGQVGRCTGRKVGPGAVPAAWPHARLLLPIRRAPARNVRHARAHNAVRIWAAQACLLLLIYRNYFKYSDHKVSDGPFLIDLGLIDTSDGSELRFGTAIDLANSNFGWSSLGKPACLPAAANSLSRSAKCRPPHHSFSATACVRSGRSPARSYQRKTCLQPTSNFLPDFFLSFCFVEGTICWARAERLNATR